MSLTKKQINRMIKKRIDNNLLNQFIRSLSDIKEGKVIRVK